MTTSKRTLHHFPRLKRPWIVRPGNASFLTMAEAQAFIERQNRGEAARAKARCIVKTGRCPTCGAALRRNLALTGWWQCAQFGEPPFRADPAAPPCAYQCFTE